MNTKLLVMPSLLIMLMACENANFGDGSLKKKGASAIPNSGLVLPENPPLDVSKLTENADQAANGGPASPTGDVLDKVIELGCDNSQGIIVDVNDGSNPPGGKPKGSEEFFLGGTEPGKVIDSDGKEVGGKPTTPTKPTDPTLPTEPPVKVPEQSQVVAKVRGKFCPTSQNSLTVLFVVDFSGSMGRHVPGKASYEHPGNDPQVNGSCGRLRAAQAIVERIRATKKPTDKITIGMVPFAGGIVTNKIMPLVDFEAFAAHVSKDTFCQYVVQDAKFGLDPVNPGGMLGGQVDASTNYTAAFTAAKTLLSGRYGRKEVFFISDGEPTSGAVDPVAGGIAAGAALRASVDNLTLNGLLLGNAGPKAAQVLVQVAGSASRVRTADNADELATQILAFPEAGIDVNSGRATLRVPPYPAANLGLRYLSPDPAQANVWIYETQPFVILGKKGETVLNIVEVEAKGLDGSTHKSVVQVRYQL